MDSSNDMLKIRFNEFKEVKTEQNLLSVVSTIFYPLGVLRTITLSLKITLQNLWIDKIPWDEDILNFILLVWNQFVAEIHLVKSIEIPWYTNLYHKKVTHIRLLGFCDDSEKSYAAVT